MSTATCAPPHLKKTEGTQAHTCRLLTREQSFTLARLQGLLVRRDAVDAQQLTASPEDQPRFVRALDGAIVSYYRLAAMLGLQTEANSLVLVYRSQVV